ncbi:MAG TPA: UDP-glucose 4-epimerase GalE [Bacteroidia bacterium]|nr:UDP-glucose 4-epimerase GalE [Bacteroidia bacterium]
MNKKRILVTGGTGYIGSHTIVELQAKGFEVLIIDSLQNSFEGVLDQIKKISGIKPKFYQFDLCDNKALTQFFETEQGIDAIIHFAALKAVGESVENPLLYYKNNMLSLINLLEAMQKYAVKHIVFSSSCTVYGQPDSLPVSESAPLKKPESPYGHTKQMAEQVLADVVNSCPLNVISLRYFNPIGAHESALIGEYPIGAPNNLVPMITQTAAGIREKLLVFGDNYNTKDGSCIRDYIHVVDIANAHVVAIERLLNNKIKTNYEVFNLGTGHGYTVLETIKTFEKVAAQKLNYEIAPRRSGDVEKVYADTTYANQELGWKAERNLENMLSSAWNWQLNLKELKIK